MSGSGPVLMIGWDAADFTLVERLCAEGRLPALASLRASGYSGRIGAEPLLFAGGVWPTFYTGKPVPWHGIYHNRLWRADEMRFEMASAERLPEPPFWERIDKRLRVAIVDVPMTVAPPRPINGVHVAGFGTHDLLVRGSYPRSLWWRIRARFGAPRLTPELFGPQSAKSLLRLRTSLLAATEQMTEISEWLLAQGSWDLFLIVLGAPHRGGHYLWDLSQVDSGAVDGETRTRLESALAEVYQACDRAVARLLARSARDVRVLVFAAHGMGPNTGWSDRLPDVLARMRESRDGEPLGHPFGFRVKTILPTALRRALAALPRSLRDRVLAPWQGRKRAWSATRYFPLDMDHAGYVRMNLKGRERYGVLDPGEYDTVCRELAAALHSLRDPSSGEPIVERTYGMSDLASDDAPYRDLLPDLVITWGRISAIGSPEIHWANGRQIRWQDPVRLPSGRSGNHRSGGWFVAAGNGIPSGSAGTGHDLVDLVPTLHRWLGVASPTDLHGHPIPELVGSTDPAP